MVKIRCKISGIAENGKTKNKTIKLGINKNWGSKNFHTEVVKKCNELYPNWFVRGYFLIQKRK